MVKRDEEVIKQILEYPDYKASQFGWDYETYMKLAETLKNKGKDINIEIF